jgi:hypothetical protein
MKIEFENLPELLSKTDEIKTIFNSYIEDNKWFLKANGLSFKHEGYSLIVENKGLNTNNWVKLRADWMNKKLKEYLLEKKLISL